MSVLTNLVIDWTVSPRTVTVGAPDTEITLQDLVDTLRYEEARTINMIYPYLVSAAGKEALGGNVYVGITVTLQDAKLAFEARGGPTFVQCNVSGGNLVAVDANGDDMDPIQTTAYTQVVRTSSSSATLQQLADIQYSSFNGGVTIDVTSSYSGTGYPVGTPRQPVNNLADAMSIATGRGFTVIYVIGDLTIDASGDYSSMIFTGESQTKTSMTVSAGANVTNCEFYDAHVDGTLDGNAKLRNCLITDLNYVYGIIETCILGLGTITLGGSDTAHFLDCWSGVVGSGTPTINMGGSGQPLSLRNYNGGIKLTNKSGTDKVSIDLNSGQVVLDSTVINGEIVIRGVGKLTDNSTATVDSDYLMQGIDLLKARKMAYNDATKSGDIVTVKDDDDTTTWEQYDTSAGGRVRQ